jgi:allantoinase
MMHFALKSRRVVFADGDRPATVVVRDGRIDAVLAHDARVDVPVEDLGDRALSPGVVDTHVHINEPGRTEWEGFVTATRAASAGGTTTVVDMPLNCIPVTTSRAALETKRAEALDKCAIDYRFWGGVVPGNASELDAMIDAGIPGAKCFLVHSGIDDFPQSREADLRLAMPILARRGAALLVHAEVPEPIDEASARLASEHADPRKYATFLASRPRASEDRAIELVVRLARETGCRVHIVHLSSADAISIVEAAKRDGVPITCETCPHYLTFTAEEIEAGATHFKCCPPIRERDNRERLWDALGRGVIDMVVSDHSPCTPALKKREIGDFMDAWGGIAGVQFAMTSVWTEAQRRGYTLSHLTRWMSQSPASLAGLSSKGAIEAGRDADLVVWNPDAETTIAESMVLHRHALTPYAGRTLRGVVERTYLRGEAIFRRGEAFPSPIGREVRAR